MAGGQVSETGLPASKFLYYELESDGWCCARTSGTEPKMKVYMGVKGESLEAADIADSEGKGWTLACVDGFPLGWGKVAEGRLKNKYYRGWRW